MPSAVPVTAMESAAPVASKTAGAGAVEDETSRIFIKNLPPNITDEQLRKHFSAGNRHITDLRLIVRRRIAFIGYQTPAEAKTAVRYFNRSYIRLSKLSVELAKPITDAPSIPTANNMKRWQEAHDSEVAANAAAAAAAAAKNDATKKRKRQDLDEASNPRLREFLDVMRPQQMHGLSSTADTAMFVGNGALGGGASEAAAAAAKEEAAALAAALRNEGESDDEYDALPAPKEKKSKGSQKEAETDTAMEDVGGDGPGKKGTDDTPSPGEEAATASIPLPTAEELKAKAAAAAALTDDDWLRSRTNRLLDLMDPSEIRPAATAAVPAAPAAASAPLAVSTGTSHAGGNEQDQEEDDIFGQNDDDDDNKPSEQHGGDGATKDADASTITPKVSLSPQEQILKTSRLFVRNLPYTVKEAEIQTYFEAYGAITEVYLPTTNTGANKGYAMVLFGDASDALAAFHNADGRTFHGRILHVLPAKAKKVAAPMDDYALSQLPLKTQRLLRKKAETASASFSWNSLFMSADAVNLAVAERLGVTKSEMLDPTSADEAVRQAVRQTSLVGETKSYFARNGVDLEAFQGSEKRGDTCILVKNFAYGTTPEQLRQMFEEFGPVVRLLMPPHGTIAIVQYGQAAHGRLAYSRLAYRRIDDTVLLLEKCPASLFANSAPPVAPAAAAAAKSAKTGINSSSDLLAPTTSGPEAEAEGQATSSLYVRNLNFTTTNEQLAEVFKDLEGFVVARVKTKPDPKRPDGPPLSMGFGFVEFRKSEQAAAACRAKDGHVLQGHTLMVRASHRGTQDAAETARAAQRAHKQAVNKGSKLIIKNVAFEVSIKDLRKLLGAYGTLKALRLPKKFGKSSRGFAFAEFTTPAEAATAMTALRNTHLLGRRLVIEYTESEALDAEEEVARMQKKVAAQTGTVELQQLTRGRSQRSRVRIGEEENGEEM